MLKRKLEKKKEKQEENQREFKFIHLDSRTEHVGDLENPKQGA